MKNLQNLQTQKIILPIKLTQKLIDISESGMGYHKVDVYLKNGRIIKNQIILNCSVLKLDKAIKKIKKNEIINITKIL